jgi:uncharacterized membrane protein YphA (DoxX/SURF4 family)
MLGGMRALPAKPWLPRLPLAGFTLAATFVANRFRGLPAGQERFMMANAFFGHPGLAGGFLLVAWWDAREAGR